MSDPHQRTAETLRAWDLAAGKYAETIDADVAALRAGVLDPSRPEREVLPPLVSPTTRLLHLQCSHAPEGPAAPQAWEHQWTLGQIVTAVAAAGLRIEQLVEYAAHFWPEFPHMPEAELARLPHSFLLVARAAAPD